MVLRSDNHWFTPITIFTYWHVTAKSFSVTLKYRLSSAITQRKLTYPLDLHTHQAIIIWYHIFICQTRMLSARVSSTHPDTTLVLVFRLYMNTRQLQQQPCSWRDSWRSPGTRRCKVSSAIFGRSTRCLMFSGCTFHQCVCVCRSKKRFESNALIH